ncbi:T-cell leukemia translocation-altered gene protein [Rhea pennata]|uniref:T-cell leukemia translocation-altered gene protein n=1 Tax=Rhea pennata TaxID=8795 RepID=UPI002E256C2C
MAAAAGWEAPWRALGALGRELAAEWAAQDLRAALCQLLLLWLGLSLLGIRLAWRAYGGAVAALCYRPGPAGRNGGGGTADRPCPPPREGPAAEPVKTHRE